MIEYNRRGDVEGVLHCYTGTLDFARRALDARLDVSFSGIVTFKTANDLREVAAALPLDRILVETDCPLLAPVPHRGQRNEPAWVEQVGMTLARVRHLPLEEIGAVVAAHEQAPGRREGQRRLATEVTALVHGPEAAAVARSVSEVLFGGSSIDEAT